MKPNTSNSLSAIGYIGLLILFNLPYVGFPAIVLFSIFAKDKGARTVAHVFLVLQLAAIAVMFILSLAGIFSFDDAIKDYFFSFSTFLA
jgi:amino acid transporter